MIEPRNLVKSLRLVFAQESKARSHVHFSDRSASLSGFSALICLDKYEKSNKQTIKSNECQAMFRKTCRVDSAIHVRRQSGRRRVLVDRPKSYVVSGTFLLRQWSQATNLVATLAGKGRQQTKYSLDREILIEVIHMRR